MRRTVLTYRVIFDTGVSNSEGMSNVWRPNMAKEFIVSDGSHVVEPVDLPRPGLASTARSATTAARAIALDPGRSSGASDDHMPAAGPAVGVSCPPSLATQPTQ